MMQTVIREINEELGMFIPAYEIAPLCLVKHYHKKNGQSCLNQTAYYWIETNKKVNRKACHLTKEEKKSLNLFLFPISEIESLVISADNEKRKAQFHHKELLMVINQYIHQNPDCLEKSDDLKGLTKRHKFIIRSHYAKKEFVA